MKLNIPLSESLEIIEKLIKEGEDIVKAHRLEYNTISQEVKKALIFPPFRNQTYPTHIWEENIKKDEKRISNLEKKIYELENTTVGMAFGKHFNSLTFDKKKEFNELAGIDTMFNQLDFAVRDKNRIRRKEWEFVEKIKKKYRTIFEKFIKAQNTWQEKCVNELNKLYKQKNIGDIFLQKYPLLKPFTGDFLWAETEEEFNKCIEPLEKRSKYLEEIHSELEKELLTKLRYDKDTCTIWYKDDKVELKPDAFQSGLCAYIFGFNQGVSKEFEDIMKEVEGVSDDEYHKENKKYAKKIRNTVNELNKKTRNSFNRHIFSISSPTVKVSLSIPKK